MALSCHVLGRMGLLSQTDCLCLQTADSVIFAKLAIIILNGERQRPFFGSNGFQIKHIRYGREKDRYF